MARRFFVFLSLMPCALSLASAVADPEPRDLNDLWKVQPIKTLDNLCMPRTFLLSPRPRCANSLKQLGLSIRFDEGWGVRTDRDEAADTQVDATLDHLW
jgi:hypothetical protein